MSEKRDIQADRVMIEKHLGWAETGSWARYFADIASHYLTRTEEAESALSSSLGASTLEYIKGLETENEAMRRLLKQTQKDYELCPGCDPETGVYGCEPHDDCGALKRYLAIDAFLKGGGQE